MVNLHGEKVGFFYNPFEKLLMINLRGRRILFFTFALSVIYCLTGFNSAASDFFPAFAGNHDSIERQILFNGRAWRNLYSKVKGDQFLFTPDLLPGNVTIGKNKFNNLRVKYDIYNDELLITTDHGIILQLNKEIVDCFDEVFTGKLYHFKRLDADSVNSLSGYVNVLYDGNVSLLIKYRKEILLLAVENKYDLFNQLHKVYLKKDGDIILINSKRDFLKQLEDHKQQVRTFIKTNKIKVTRKNPESFQPVVEYYDRLRYPNQ
jgi:hypothetical protein